MLVVEIKVITSKMQRTAEKRMQTLQVATQLLGRLGYVKLV